MSLHFTTEESLEFETSPYFQDILLRGNGVSMEGTVPGAGTTFNAGGFV
jgi:hypothetical protein